MNRSTVALERCDGYDPERAYSALKRGIERLGGLDRFVRSGERILLKPNILSGVDPDLAVTTAEILRQSGQPGKALTVLDDMRRSTELPAESWSVAATARRRVRVP